MPLPVAPQGRTFTIRKLLVRDLKTKKHLESLGLVAHQPIKVMSQGKEGTVILVNETRLALDMSTASSVFVE
jgi:Fe2+ transport system protein FeoA